MDEVKSFAPEVMTGADPKFYGNMLRFATYEEALAYAKDLMGRWTTVTDYRAVESGDAVNYRWDFDAQAAKPVSKPKEER